jgi:hypothetical protein
MPITLNCTCGKTLRIADEHAGKRVKCPACNAVIASKPPAPQFEVVEDEPQRPLPSARPVAQLVAKPSHDDDDDTDSYGMKAVEKTPKEPATKPNFRRRADSDDDDDEDDRPRRRRGRGSMSREAAAHSGAEAGRRIGYILGGGVMLPLGIGLAIWGNNGEGRGATRLLILGICLGIAGLISLIQGLTGNLPDEE